MIVLDTSSIIRFLTNDDEKKALLVKKLLESDHTLIIPDVALPEIEYVLQHKAYNATRPKILEVFRFFLSCSNVKLSKEVKKAIELYSSTNLDIADCIIASTALLSDNKLASFDKELLKVADIEKCF